MAYLLSKPDDWKVFVSDLIKHGTDGEKGIRAGLEELKRNNYLQRYPVYENRKITHWETVVYETPFGEDERIKYKVMSGSLETSLLAEKLQVGKDTLLINDYTNIKNMGYQKINGRYYLNGKRVSKTEYQIHCTAQLHDAGAI